MNVPGPESPETTNSTPESSENTGSTTSGGGSTNDNSTSQDLSNLSTQVELGNLESDVKGS